MIDIHCHILPDIDDGPATFEQSLAMARMAAEDGVDVIVATPHVNEQLYDPVEISRRASWLRHLMRLENIPLTLLTGADVNTVFAPQQVKQFTINETDYILVEFPHTHLPASAKNILFQFRIHGMKPIITHPERNPSIKAKPSLLLELLDDGIFVQVTAGSVAGEFGRGAEKCAHYLLAKGVVDVLASDGHSPEYRKPLLSHGMKAAAEILGEEEARKLVFTNPMKIIANMSFER